MSVDGRRAFAGGRVITPTGILEDASVVCHDGRIVSVERGDPVDADDIIDCAGDFLAPGTFDVHIHGAAGCMVEEATAEAIASVASAMPQYGVTAFLPTFATSSLETIRAGFTAVREVKQSPGGNGAARIPGVHLEGPYLNPERAGAQPARYMREPNVEEMRALVLEADGLIKLVTLAPELPNGLDLVRFLCAQDIVVSAGHTDATAAQITEAVAAGVSHATHLFNAMRGIHHREPGAAGALLHDDRVTCELICDGHHVHPTMLAIALQGKPEDRAVLVTDAVAPLGWEDGAYDLFGVKCLLANGTIRLAANGALAGSVLSMDHAIRNLTTWFPERPGHLWWRYAATNPAEEMGCPDYGRIAPGAVADVVRYTSALLVRETYLAGTCVYAASAADV